MILCFMTLSIWSHISKIIILAFKNEKLILQKINDLQDIFNRDIIYKKVEINDSYPEYLIDNIDNYKEWII